MALAVLTSAAATGPARNVESRNLANLPPYSSGGTIGSFGFRGFALPPCPVTPGKSPSTGPTLSEPSSIA